MYLEGQLPTGPDSSNLGGTVDTNPTAVSGLDISSFLLPASDGGGQDVVSGTVAHDNGIVQPPVSNPVSQSTPLQMGGSAQYGECGSYAADGSLITIRTRAGRGMGSVCQSGYQSFKDPSVPGGGLLALAAGIALVVVGLSGGRR